jgi:hypothetical protein
VQPSSVKAFLRVHQISFLFHAPLRVLRLGGGTLDLFSKIYIYVVKQSPFSRTSHTYATNGATTNDGTYFTQGGGFLIPKESQLKGEERKWRKKEEEERRNIYHSSL